MDADDNEDQTRGWPTGDRNPYLVEGQIQQLGKLAEGLKRNRAGRLRAVRLTLWFVAVSGVILAADLLWSALR